jgi:hypothetical protein
MVNNPYRQKFENAHSSIICDFSTMIPSWNLILSGCWSKDLIRDAIDYAEQKGYYSFYTRINFEKLELYKNHVNADYEIIIEEIVPPNEKPVSILFWDWVCSSSCINKETCIVYHVLPQRYRNDKR